MRQLLLAVTVALWVGPASLALGQKYADIPLNPGERLIAVDGVPVNGEAASEAAAPAGKDDPAKQAATDKPAAEKAATETKESKESDTKKSKEDEKSSSDKDAEDKPEVVTNIEGKLVRSNVAFSHTPGETALEKANHERRRNGVGALKPDPALQKLALKKARIAASRRYKNHIGGSLGGARAEGVGWTQGRFLSCCLDMRATYGGAAMVQGSDGWYCCLLVR